MRLVSFRHAGANKFGAAVDEVGRQMPSVPSTFSRLHDTLVAPGDIIATGTPDGVGTGRTPPLWMKAGDRLKVEISGIGTLGVNVVDE